MSDKEGIMIIVSNRGLEEIYVNGNGDRRTEEYYKDLLNDMGPILNNFERGFMNLVRDVRAIHNDAEILASEIESSTGNIIDFNKYRK